MNRTSNTLSENVRTKSVALLNRHLAAAIDLQGQLKQAHWNARGPAFAGVHALFDKIAGAADGYADTLAERAAALGGTAEGTIQLAAERSFLEPYTLGLASDQAHIAAVTAALSSFGDSVRRAVDDASSSGDPSTADLLTGISRDVDQQLWLVEAHVTA